MWYNNIKGDDIMDIAYNNSLQMIKLLGIKLTKKQYNQLAVRFNLLSADTIQFITKMNFNYWIKQIIN